MERQSQRERERWLAGFWGGRRGRREGEGESGWRGSERIGEEVGRCKHMPLLPIPSQVLLVLRKEKEKKRGKKKWPEI